MKAVVNAVSLGIALLAISGTVGPVGAATVTITGGTLISGISSLNTYVYGDTTFTFASCSIKGAGTCSNFDLLAVFNGRGGTEIEIEHNPTSSPILSDNAGNNNISAAFTVTVGVKTGNQGISTITNIVAGSAASGNTGYVTSVLSAFNEAPGGSVTPSGVLTASLAANSQVATLPLKLNATSTLTFTDTLNINSKAASGGSALKLTNVALLLNPAPEPASIALFATGLLGLAAVRRRFGGRAKR